MQGAQYARATHAHRGLLKAAVKTRLKLLNQNLR